MELTEIGVDKAGEIGSDDFFDKAKVAFIKRQLEFMR